MALSPTSSRSSAAAPSSVLITSQVLAGTAASFDTGASIPATYNHLLLKLYARSDTAATSANVTLTFNNDGGANYDRETLWGAAAVPTSNEALAQTSLLVCEIPGGNAPASVFSQGTWDIANYAGTTGQKSLTGSYSGKRGTTTGLVLIFTVAGWWRSTAAINRIILTPVGNFVAGSAYYLYGIT